MDLKTEGEPCLQPNHQQSRYRWIVLALLCGLLFFNGFLNSAVSPIGTKVAQIYDVSLAWANSPSIISFLIFSLVNFPANYIIDSYGLRVSFLTASILMALGTGCYLLIQVDFKFVVLASVLVSIGQPFIVNCPSKLAITWFFPQKVSVCDIQRTITITIISIVTLLGSGAGFVLPSVFVKEEYTTAVARQQLFRLYVIYAVCALCLALFTYCFMRDKPIIAPSSSAKAQSLSFLRSLKVIRKDKNLWLFLIAYFFIYGPLLTLGSSINFLLKPYNYSNVFISISAILLIISGAIGSVSFSCLINKTSNYKGAMVGSSVSAVILLLVTTLALQMNGAEWVMMVIFVGVGLVLPPIVPMSYDLGCELSFPIGQAMITGILNGGSLIWAFCVSIIIASGIGYGTTLQSLISFLLLTSACLVGSILLCCLKYDLKRTAFESNPTLSIIPSHPNHKQYPLQDKI